jgi:hypothetical protein
MPPAERDEAAALLKHDPETGRNAALEQAGTEQRWACGSVAAGVTTVLVCIGYTLVGPLLIISNK